MTNTTDKSGLDREALVDEVVKRLMDWQPETYQLQAEQIIDLILSEYEKQVVDAVEALRIYDHPLMRDQISQKQTIEAIKQVRK